MLLALIIAGLFTLDAAAWYRRLGWLDGGVVPIVKPLDDPILAWIEAHREVDRLYGEYWDVYRLSFLTGGRVEGVPSGHYPDRFARGSAGHPGTLIARGTPVGAEIRARALREGGRDLFAAGGGVIVRWP